MTKLVIFNTQIEELNTDKADLPDVCKKYPGAEWLPLLRAKLKSAGCLLMSAQEAIDLNVDFTTASVIQEQWDARADLMLSLGATFDVGYCFESKMYAPEFWDQIEEVKKKVKHQYYFGEGNRLSAFPSYSSQLKRLPVPYSDRRFICMVAANKQCWNLPAKPESESFRKALRNELHSTRLKIIETFARPFQFDLFGHGWHQFHFPYQFTDAAIAIHNLKAEPISDKHTIQSLYKFSFAIENTAEPYYLTEKLIHCLAAHTVPVYLGDPMVHNYVPKKAYVDIRDFRSYEELYSFLAGMRENEWADMIEAGRAYLKTNEGKCHSFEYWADDIFKRIHQKTSYCGAV